MSRFLTWRRRGWLQRCLNCLTRPALNNPDRLISWNIIFGLPGRLILGKELPTKSNQVWVQSWFTHWALLRDVHNFTDTHQYIVHAFLSWGISNEKLIIHTEILETLGSFLSLPLYFVCCVKLLLQLLAAGTTRGKIHRVTNCQENLMNVIDVRFHSSWSQLDQINI